MTSRLPASAPSRRTVTKGAAWAAPAVVVAGAAPTLAASTICEPPAPGTWTNRLLSGTAGIGTNGYYGDSRYRGYGTTGRRAATPRTTATRTRLTGLVPGATYTVTVDVRTGYGNNCVSTSEGAGTATHTFNFTAAPGAIELHYRVLWFVAPPGRVAPRAPAATTSAATTSASPTR